MFPSYVFLNLRFPNKLNSDVDLVYLLTPLTLQTRCKTWAEWNHVVSEPVFTLRLDHSCMLLPAHALIKANLELLSTQILSKGPLDFSCKTKIQCMCFEVLYLTSEKDSLDWEICNDQAASLKCDLKFASHSL